MTRWAVTLVCAAGVALAAFLSIRFGRRNLLIDRRDSDEVVGAWPGAARGLRAATVAVLSGGLTTLLVLGLGGRLMMRIAGATSSESVQGLLTDADERIGEVSVGGTLSFVFFFTVFVGGAVGVLYGLLRRYLPGPAWFAGLIPAVIVAGLAGPSDFSNPNNKDFRILGPTWVISLMLLGLIVLFGATLGSTYEWLNTRVPRPTRSKRAIVWYLPVAPMALMPFNLAFIGFAGLGGAALPASARDAVQNRTFSRIVGALAAAAATYFAVVLATDLVSIAT